MPNQIFSSRSVPAVRFFIHLALLLLLCGSTIGQQYFPEGVFDDEKQANDSIVDQYSRYLKALQEPSLWETSKRTKGPVYENHEWSRRLRAGEAVEDRTKKLSKQQTQWFLDRVEELKYWELPSREQKAPNVLNLDGAQWVVEGVRDGNYKLVDRWSPGNGPIKTIGIMMTIDLANMKLLYQDVY